jgi:hypothetical protein
MKAIFKLMILALASFGGYTLWNRYGSELRDRFANADGSGPGGRRVMERSDLTVTEWAAGSDDPTSQATAILTDSDERSSRPRTSDGVERRRSEETVEP